MKRALGMLIVLLSASIAGSQPLADRVPDDAILYLGFSGTDNAPGYEGTHWEAIVKQSNFPAVFRQVLPAAIKKQAARDAIAAGQAQQVYDALAVLARKPSAVFFAGFRLDGERPMPRVGFVCRAGADAEPLQQKIQALLDQAGEKEIPLKVTVIGEDLVFTVGYENPEAALAGGERGALQAVASFAAARKHVLQNPVVCLWVDIEKGLALVDSVVQVEADPQQQEMYAKVMDALGIRGLQNVMLTGGFDGKDWMEQGFLAAPAPRTGLLSLMDNPPIQDETLKAIPAGADLFTAGSFDVAKLLSTARDIAGQVHPQGQQSFDQGMGVVKMAIGKDLLTDILEPLGSQWAMYMAPEVAGGGIFGLVALNKTDDAAKMRSGLMNLSIFATNSANSGLAAKDAPVVIAGRQVKYDGATINYLGLPLVAPSWSVQGDYLLLGLYPQTLIGASRQLNSGKSILDNAEYQKLRERLGQKEVHGVNFMNLPQTAASSYGVLMALTQLVGAADLFGIQTPHLVLPPMHVFMEHMGPAGGVSWVDDAGAHMKRVSPFPGAEIFSGGASLLPLLMAPQAVGAAVALPAMSRGRESAQRVKCAQNLRQILQAAIMYANEHQNEFPADMAALAGAALAYNVDASVFICPDSHHVPLPPNWHGMPRDEQVQWILDNTSYEYIGGGKAGDAAAETVLLHEHPWLHGGQGMNLGYADGHVEFHAMDTAMRQIEETRQRR